MNATTLLQETDPFTFPIAIFQILFKTFDTIYFSKQEISKNFYDIMCAACEFLSAKSDATAFCKWFLKIPIGISDGITFILESSSVDLSFLQIFVLNHS